MLGFALGGLGPTLVVSLVGLSVFDIVLGLHKSAIFHHDFA